MARTTKNFEGELCEECGIAPKRYKGLNAAGTEVWGRTCDGCRKRPYMKHRKKLCEMCGYSPFFHWALEVHHRDGDNKNNDKDNLMTVCANCHRELEATVRELDGNYTKAEAMVRRFVDRMLR